MPMDGHSATYERLRTHLEAQLVEVLADEPNGRPRPDRQDLEATLQQNLRTVIQETRLPPLSLEEEMRLIRQVLDEVVGGGPLSPLLADPTVTEVMVNGPRQVYVERRGRLERTAVVFRDANHLMSVLERLLDAAGVTITESEPCVDASLPDGTRLNAIIPPLVLNGPTVTLRKRLRQWTMGDVVGQGSLSPHAATFLEACVKAKVNVVISGGTSTGKTTLVNMLSLSIPQEERIITIENVPELELQGREHWIRLVARNPNMEGRGEVSLRMLVHNALRMRPDRLILGEARGGEALDVVQAMHTGHEGVITILHANAPQAALERLETLMLMSGLELPAQACRMQIASVVELVVHLSRFPDGTRKVTHISQVGGAEASGFILEDLFRFELKGLGAGQILGELVATGARPRFMKKLETAGVQLTSELFHHA